MVGSGGSFGGSSLQLELGLGKSGRVRKLTVRWPGSANVSLFEDVAAGRFYRVVDRETELEALTLPAFRLGG